MKVESRQSHVQNVQLRDDPSPTPSGSGSSVDVGGQKNAMVMMVDEEDALHGPIDGSRGFSDDGCRDVKEESVEVETHDEEVILEVSVSPKAEPFAIEDERNSNRLPSSNKCVDRRQPRQQQYSTIAPLGTESDLTTGSNQQTIQRVPGENPSYSLLKQLQADLLNALLEKEDVVSENKILREKLKACEKKVKELTKKLNNSSQAHQTQGSTKTQTQQPSLKLKNKKESINRKKANLKESKGKKESRTQFASLKIKIKKRMEQTETGSSVTSVVSPVEVDDDDNIAAPSAEKETLSSLCNTMSGNDVIHVDVDVDDDKIDSLEVVEDWDIEDRPKRAACKKLFYDELTDPQPKPTQKDRNKKLREKIKEDPVHYAAFKKSEALRLKRYRAGLTEKKKKLQRQKRRVRDQKKKEDDVVVPKTKERPAPVATRASQQALVEKRERNNAAQRKRRANMSSQKKRRERELGRTRYHSKKAEKL